MPNEFENFICPECGSRELGEMRLAEKIFVAGDVWSAILQEDQCTQCGSIIPAHLAERWNGLSLEKARAEWREIYRDCQPDWSEE